MCTLKKCFICKHGEETANVMLSEHLRKYGCSVIHVFDADPRFSYTLGVEAMSGCAEVIAPFLSDNIALPLLNAYNEMVKDGKVFKEGVVYDDFLEFISVNVVFKKVLKNKYAEYLGRAIEFYGTSNFEVWQMVLPDKNGLFPWDNGCAEFFCREENVLFEQVETKAYTLQKNHS